MGPTTHAQSPYRPAGHSSAASQSSGVMKSDARLVGLSGMQDADDRIGEAPILFSFGVPVFKVV
jgi:hypothetical protein